jgi:CheY-like chemotaxis protein
MPPISIVTRSTVHMAELSDALPGEITADYVRYEDLAFKHPHDTTILDIDLGKPSEVQTVKQWLTHRRRSGKVIVCIDAPSSHWKITQARALGATDVLTHPFQPKTLRRILFDAEHPADASPLLNNSDHPSHDLAAVERIFAAARSGQPPRIQHLKTTAETTAERIRASGIVRLSFGYPHPSQPNLHALPHGDGHSRLFRSATRILSGRHRVVGTGWSLARHREVSDFF